MIQIDLFLEKLRRIVRIIFLLTAPVSGLYAQYFSNSYDLDQTSNTGITIIPVEDGLLISVGTICGLTTTLVNCVGLLKTDFEGNVIWTKIIDGFKTPTENSMIVDGNYIYLAVQHNIPPPANIKIFKLDLSGNIVGEWELGETLEYEIPFGVIKYREGFVIYSLLFPPEQENNAWILFTDSLFTVYQEVLFLEEEPNFSKVVSKDLKATRDGNLIATQLLGNRAAITKLDSAGNILWHQRLPLNTGFDNLYNIRITELHDGGFAVTWLKENPFVGEFYQYPPSIFKLDADGNILWERVFNTLYTDYETKFTGNIFTAANGDIIGAGNRYFFNEDIERYAVCGWTFRLDPETGEVLWDRTLCDASRSLQYFMAFIDGAELPNGDLVFTGIYEDTFPNAFPYINDPNAWLVRLSAKGCLVEEGCGEWTIINPDGSITATEESLPGDNHFVVYPNPGNGQVWIAPNGAFLRNQPCQIMLYDAQGRPVKEENFQADRLQQFDWGDLPPGMYYYLIRTNAGGAQSGKLVIVR